MFGSCCILLFREIALCFVHAHFNLKNPISRYHPFDFHLMSAVRAWQGGTLIRRKKEHKQDPKTEPWYYC